MISSSASGPPTTRKESVKPPNVDGVSFQGSPLSLGLRTQTRTLWACQVKEQAEQEYRGHTAYFRTLTESYPTLQKKQTSMHRHSSFAQTSAQRFAAASHFLYLRFHVATRCLNRLPRG
jgi:hypothetical protein